VRRVIREEVKSMRPCIRALAAACLLVPAATCVERRPVRDRVEFWELPRR